MATIKHPSLLYTRRRGKFLRKSVERWKQEHDEATLCWELEQLIRDVERHFRDVIDLDARVQNDYFGGRPFDTVLDSGIRRLFVLGAELADKCELLVVDMERRGYVVAGATEFRAMTDEIRAAARPNDEMPDGLIAVRDAALAQHRAGECERWQ